MKAGSIVRRKSILTVLGILCGWNLLLFTPARGQVNPDILVQPWQQEPHWAETVDEILIFNQAHTKGTDLATDIFYWDSDGRIKTDKQNNDPRFVIGYKVLAMTLDSRLGPINGDYWDVAIVGAGRLCDLGDGWQLNALGGAGTANDNHWGNTEAIYGVGALGVCKQLNATTSFHSGIYYDGNRVLWPEVPLPYIAYRREFNDRFTCTFGVPQTSIVYRPIQRLPCEIDYTFPERFTARVSIELTKKLMLFCQYVRGTDTFHINDRGNERLFYELQRASGGVRWITKWFDASIGVGYALDQEFTRGHDIRHPSAVVMLSEEPFASLKIQGTF